MDKFFNQTLQKLETAINDIEIETPCSIERIEAVIQHIIDCLSEVKEYVLEKGFKSLGKEIRLFKYQKQVIVAKLIYYNAIYKIEAGKPYGAKPIRKHLNKELKKLKRFFDNNLDFYKYYRSNNSYLDENFFCAGQAQYKAMVGHLLFSDKSDLFHFK